MKRRAFIALLGGAAAASWGFTAWAQAPAKLWRVGIIVGGARTPSYDGFLQGMQELGYVSGRDYVADWRSCSSFWRHRPRRPAPRRSLTALRRRRQRPSLLRTPAMRRTGAAPVGST